MFYFHIDASALAKRYLPELGTPLVNQLFASCHPRRFIVFNVGVAEVVSILVRRRNAGHISAAAFAQALAEFGAEMVHETRVRKVFATSTLVTAALRLIPLYSVNATDAIILQSALERATKLRAKGHDLVLVASDQRLLKAAQAEGLATFDPETQDQAVLAALLS